MHWAALGGRETIVKLLLESGADVDLIDATDDTDVSGCETFKLNRTTSITCKLHV